MTDFVYRCFDCGKEFGRDEVRYLCPVCQKKYRPGRPLRGVLEVKFDYDSIGTRLLKGDFPCHAEPGSASSPPSDEGILKQVQNDTGLVSSAESNRASLGPERPDWSLLCAVEKEFHPPFPVGNTPLLWSKRLAERLGLSAVGVKFDGLNPSGSLKDRASFLIVAEALRLGERKVVVASTGNAASATAAACAAAGLEAVVFVPKTAPKAKLVQMMLCGAQVVTVNGTYDDAFRMSLQYTKEKGGINRNTAYHPLTIEGKKTVAFEICEQTRHKFPPFEKGGAGGDLDSHPLRKEGESGFRAPGAVVVPVGDGVIISGVYKGLYDLLRCGLIEKIPRLIAVQAERSDAIHRLITTGKYRSAAAPRTIADSISVSTPSNAYMAAQRVKESGGFSITVSDAEIMSAQKLLAKTTGVFAEPAAAAPLAGLLKADKESLEDASDIVLLVTGHGLKDIDVALTASKLPEPIEPEAAFDSRF